MIVGCCKLAPIGYRCQHKERSEKALSQLYKLAVRIAASKKTGPFYPWKRWNCMLLSLSVDKFWQNIRFCEHMTECH